MTDGFPASNALGPKGGVKGATPKADSNVSPTTTQTQMPPSLTKACQCECTTHLDSGSLVEHSRHEYMQHFPSDEVKPIKTIYGTFDMCPECAQTFPEELKDTSPDEVEQYPSSKEEEALDLSYDLSTLEEYYRDRED